MSKNEELSLKERIIILIDFYHDLESTDQKELYQIIRNHIINMNYVDWNNTAIRFLNNSDIMLQFLKFEEDYNSKLRV